jgi:hypothetical protein
MSPWLQRPPSESAALHVLLYRVFQHYRVSCSSDLQSLTMHLPQKRRRVGIEQPRHTVHEKSETPVFTGVLPQNVTSSRELSDEELEYDIAEVVTPQAPPIVRNITPAQRPISPPPVKRADKPPLKAVTRMTSKVLSKPKEALNPRVLLKAPADHRTRFVYLKKLHEGMVRLNDEAGLSTDPSIKALELSDGELITVALDEEEKIAKENPAVYANVIKLRMVVYAKRMTLGEWKIERIKATSAAASIEKNISTKGAELVTGLTSKEELQVLVHLIADQTGLDRYGYVTAVPTDIHVREAKETMRISQGYEQCDRCQTRFQVFPERREDGALTTGGRCRHHHGRIVYTPRNSSGGYTGAKERYYSCCNETVGQTAGCAYADTHVFNIKDIKRLAAIMQFASTPENPNLTTDGAVCFDCEMGYTVNGLELIRLTAVSWPDGELLLDVLVRPLGQVLDLNSRYSGVHAKDFLGAKPYDETQDIASQSTELRIVESPQVARKLLFKLLTPRTPLLGHAIDNDLNTTRVVHPTIVDTVLLFPHPAGLPRRRALKALTKQILDRDIQTSHGAGGHDSKEDAIATGDLVRWQVAKKWREMQSEGWKLEDGKLVTPRKLGQRVALNQQAVSNCPKRSIDEVLGR